MCHVSITIKHARTHIHTKEKILGWIVDCIVTLLREPTSLDKPLLSSSFRILVPMFLNEKKGGGGGREEISYNINVEVQTLLTPIRTS
jgi:hypothetical protein